MKKNNKIKKSVSVLAFLFVCALSVILSSCSDELDIQQSYPFKVETMPVYQRTLCVDRLLKSAAS